MATAVTAGGSIAAYNAAEQAQRDYDEMMAGKEADAAADRQARIDFITQNMKLSGFSQEEIDDALRNAGFQNGGRVGFKEGGDSSNILRNFRDAFSEIIGFPSYVLRDEQEFLKDLLEDPDDLSMKEIKAQMKSENAPTRKYLDNLSGEEKKDALNKIIDDQIKADLGRTSGLFEALESLRSRGMAMSEGGSSSIEQQKRENYFDLKRDEFMSMSEYLQSGLSDTDLRSGAAEGGIMNLKVKGMPAEMDLRRGGFVPIGAKEKADDVPARLSKNEFVMTADAVRAAGGGSVNKGAKKMYDLMNKLEARV
jgi:predicted house-cleaning NTP pyrophosphatase (Maf/HAM1 superfamily)